MAQAANALLASRVSELEAQLAEAKRRAVASSAGQARRQSSVPCVPGSRTSSRSWPDQRSAPWSSSRRLPEHRSGCRRRRSKNTSLRSSRPRPPAVARAPEGRTRCNRDDGNRAPAGNRAASHRSVRSVAASRDGTCGKQRGQRCSAEPARGAQSSFHQQS